MAEANMKARYVSELAEGTSVDAPFALRAKELRVTRAGEAYLSLELADRTGSIPAVLFRPSAAAVDVPVGAVVRASGTVTRFRGSKRISLTVLAAAERWERDDLLAAGTRSRDELVAELRELVRLISDAPLARLVRAVFADSAFFERFRDCPASQSYHHAHLGGLLEHTVAVADLCRTLGDRYPGLDADLLLTAALLHDVGKVDELVFDTDIAYSDEGRLIGHVVLGVRRVRAAAVRVRLDESRLVELEHALLSHHGELEWGSPKRPSTLEALLLHHADNLDAKAAGFAHLVSGASRAQERWTDAENLFRRPLHAPRAAEDDRPLRSVEEGQHVALSA